jgi:hypothetical protein
MLRRLKIAAFSVLCMILVLPYVPLSPILYTIYGFGPEDVMDWFNRTLRSMQNLQPSRYPYAEE